MKTFDKLALIEIKDRKVLVTLSKGNHTWYFPGGKRENGETDIQALIREIKEELAVTIDPSYVKLYGIFKAPSHEKPTELVIKMLCYTATYTGTIMPNSEIEKTDYFTYSQKNVTSAVDQLVFEYLKNKGLID